jgi:mannose-1-phosphate guanylyltransferase
MSRAARPKQFLPLTGSLSLFQQTLLRVADRELYAPPVVITNADYRFIVAEQAADLDQYLSGILLEPLARNTAPAIATAAVFVRQQFGSEAVLLVLPSDHEVIAGAEYHAAIQQAAGAAEEGQLVTFGIVPTHPETGYGYIRTDAVPDQSAREVIRFVEKPDRSAAEQMLLEGGYYWNSGMFMFRADSFLAECETLTPETLAAAEGAVAAALIDLDFVRLDPAAFAAAPNISVDYAIFEKSECVAAIAVQFPWSDLGSWDAIWKTSARDDGENVSRGPVTLSNVRRSLVFSEHAHVAVDGVEDVAVIATHDAVYVGRLSQAQQVSALVKGLKANKATAALTETHQTAYRPWGGYSSVLSGDRFQVKRLFVKPGKKLSLQKHHHRAEHWVVVRGTAEVTLDGSVSVLTENESIYLPLGCTHRLANPGRIDLELIEVQTGSYLGEDDIIRLEDEFGRT